MSSTYNDLIDHRRIVIEGLERIDLESGRMEIFGAASEDGPGGVARQGGTAICSSASTLTGTAPCPTASSRSPTANTIGLSS